jgi:hypothetical protein
MNCAARLQISAQSRSSSMHRIIILMSGSRKQDVAHCSHAVTHSLQASIQFGYCGDGITFLLICLFLVSANVAFAKSLHSFCANGRLRFGTRAWKMGDAALPKTDPPRAVLRRTVGNPPARRSTRRETPLAETCVLLAVGSARYLLIGETSLSVQNSSVRAASHPAPSATP